MIKLHYIRIPSMDIAIKCKKHPTYKGLRIPKVLCAACQRIYDWKHALSFPFHNQNLTAK